MQLLRTVAAPLTIGWLAFSYFFFNNVPVSIYRLDALLPVAPQGWLRGPNRGENPSTADGTGVEQPSSSVARRTYSAGARQVTIEIWDWGGGYPYHMPIDIPGWLNGAQVNIGAETGRLRYDAGTKKGRLRVRCLDRFYIVVSGEGIERRDFDTWFRRVDLGGLRREVQRLRESPISR